MVLCLLSHRDNVTMSASEKTQTRIVTFWHCCTLVFWGQSLFHQLIKFWQLSTSAYFKKQNKNKTQTVATCQICQNMFEVWGWRDFRCYITTPLERAFVASCRYYHIVFFIMCLWVVTDKHLCLMWSAEHLIWQESRGTKKTTRTNRQINIMSCGVISPFM